MEGNWSGLAGERSSENSPIHLTLGFEGSLRIDGLEAVPIRDVSVEGATFRFKADTSIGEIVIEGRGSGSLLAGQLARASRLDAPIPFALNRVP